ncbi:hypothetical protein C8Q77DRAFT_426331 [Trametes polyzona]|nr:hypothetical protein C8Q77DRAFT_426331 [Trametes polyzona]
MATRPGPLMPYPPELFKGEARASATPAKHLRPNKRPLSPGVGCLDSPAKRRLKAEGSASRAGHTRSPLSASSNSSRFAPSHFHALLEGPDSPAKKLDFGSSRSTSLSSGDSESTACDTPRSGSRTPRRSPKRTSTTRVRRSPRLASKASTSVFERAVVEEHTHTVVEVASSSVRVSAPEPILVPRTVIPPDVQSIHYPGFDIYQDPHIILPSTSSLLPVTAPGEATPDQDHEKENQAALLSPSSKRLVLGSTSEAKPMPPSPHPKHVCDYLSGIHVTPKERAVRAATSPASTLVSITPGRTPLGKEERKQMRKALEDEADEFDGVDDL